MIRKIIMIAVTVVAFIIGVSIFLQPNDLASCGVNPGLGGNCQSVDAIVAISGGDTRARVGQAVTLYKNGWSGILVFSGAAEDKEGPSNAAVMKQQAIEAGVPATSIFIDEKSETTKQNAENTSAMFNELNVTKIILVTSGYHQRRASLEFNKRSINTTILNSPVQVDQDWSFWWWITPRGWWLTVSELVKIAFFYIPGLN